MDVHKPLFLGFYLQFAPQGFSLSISKVRQLIVICGYAFCRFPKSQRETREQGLDRLLVHPDVGAVADAKGFFEFVQGGAAPQKPDC